MDIINIGNMVVNNYILSLPSGYMVIDTGYAGGFERFCRELKKHSITLGEIRYVFLTHAHDDHAGFINELLQATDAKVILHWDSPQRLLGGHNPQIGGRSTLLAKFFVSLMALAGKGKHEFPPVDVSGRSLVWDGKTQIIKEQGIPFTIVALPGHTADSIGLLTDDGKLFCGDAAMNNFPSTKRVIIWIEDLQAYKGSWDAMIECGAKEIYPGHGKPFPAGDLMRFRGFLEKIKLR